MVIDCETCIARPRACGDCVVTHLLAVRGSRDRPGGVHPGVDGDADGWSTVSLDDAEVVAVATMAAAGLVPPLRLIRGGQQRDGSSPDLPGFVTPREDMPVRAVG